MIACANVRQIGTENSSKGFYEDCCKVFTFFVYKRFLL